MAGEKGEAQDGTPRFWQDPAKKQAHQQHNAQVQAKGRGVKTPSIGSPKPRIPAQGQGSQGAVVSRVGKMVPVIPSEGLARWQLPLHHRVVDDRFGIVIGEAANQSRSKSSAGQEQDPGQTAQFSYGRGQSDRPRPAG